MHIKGYRTATVLNDFGRLVLDLVAYIPASAANIIILGILRRKGITYNRQFVSQPSKEV